MYLRLCLSVTLAAICSVAVAAGGGTADSKGDIGQQNDNVADVSVGRWTSRLEAAHLLMFAGNRWTYCSASSADGKTIYYSDVFSVDIGDVYGQGDPEQYGHLVNDFVDYLHSNHSSSAGKGAVCYQSATSKGNTQETVTNVKDVSKESQTGNGNKNVETHWSR